MKHFKLTTICCLLALSATGCNLSQFTPEEGLAIHDQLIANDCIEYTETGNTFRPTDMCLMLLHPEKGEF